MSLAGTYLITSAIGNTVYLTPSHAFSTSFAAPVIAGTPTFGTPDQWNLVPAGTSDSNLYTVTRGMDFLFVEHESEEVWITFDTSIANATEFSVESAGDNLVRFHVPGQDGVWTLDTAGGEVRVAPDEGLSGQRWVTVNINGLD